MENFPSLPKMIDFLLLFYICSISSCSVSEEGKLSGSAFDEPLNQSPPAKAR